MFRANNVSIGVRELKVRHLGEFLLLLFMSSSRLGAESVSHATPGGKERRGGRRLGFSKTKKRAKHYLWPWQVQRPQYAHYGVV